MKILKIKTKTKNYDIIVKKNSILSNIKKEKKISNKIFIIIDKKIEYLVKKIEKEKNIYILKIKGNEKIKDFKNYKNLCEKLLYLQIDRHSTIIAIGGGTVGDLSGFVASTILRGVRFVLIPTTLLSQVDSSIGGKNGVNSISGKNLIGTFFQPDKVIIDISVLKTLSKREIISGYSEILKHSIIKDLIFFKWLSINYKRVINLETNYIYHAIIKSIKIKSFFVEKDENEKLTNNYSRAILNFGHTFGHALEAVNNYNTNKLNHGEAVAIGMGIASLISYKKKILNKNEYDKIIDHLEKTKLYKRNYIIKNKKVFKKIILDKKNYNGKVNLILLKKIGSPIYKKGLKIEEIKKLLNN